MPSSTSSPGASHESNDPTVWQLNVMHGTFTDTHQIEDIVKNYATSEDPSTVKRPHITLPMGVINMKVPINLRLRSHAESETNLGLDGCSFIVKSALEAIHRHKETDGFTIIHPTNYRKARLRREIEIRNDEVIDHTNSSDNYMFRALGTLCLPEAIEGKMVANHVVPGKFDDTLLKYGEYLAGSFSIFGGFH